MPDTIPDLWSDDITVNVVTPLVILRKQAQLLTQKTKGVLEADVQTVFGDAGLTRHEFDIYAPALGYRQRLFTATHQEQVYPVTLEAECFQRKIVAGQLAMIREAATEEQFLELVGEILRSIEVRSAIQSLIARSNELRPALSPPSASDDGNSSE